MACITGMLAYSKPVSFLCKAFSGLSLKRIIESNSTTVAIPAKYKFMVRECFLASSGKLISLSSKKIDGTKHPTATPKILA